MLNFVLAGNPNSGKTTLFNALTGSNSHVGNFPGVTVEHKEGIYKGHNTNISIMDLPGIYSLSPYSQEEIVSRNYILENKPDLIINIIDATNIERNLYLTSQLMEIGIPVIIALNMMDEVESLGDKINITKIENMLGIKAVPISAAKNQGIDSLISTALEASKAKATITKSVLYNTDVQPIIEEIRKIADNQNESISLFSAIKLLEADERTIEKLSLSTHTKDLINAAITQYEQKMGIELEIYIADLRYKYITSLVNKAIVKKQSPYKLTTTDKIDLIITNKYLALPIFFVIMFSIFEITFGKLGSLITDNLDTFINDILLNYITTFLTNINVASWLIGLIADGIFTGVGMVIIFLPQILLLFLFLSILEDTGYMARAAFIMDKLLRHFGLSGKSFVPLLMGFGCTVPAIMATRTLENERDRRMTIILTPFMSCGARMPVYVIFGSALFGQNAGIMVISLYCLGILIALLSGLLLKNTVLKGEAQTFIMELPTYRLPSLRSVLLNVWEKAKSFISKALSILLIASIFIWFLQSFDFNLNMVTNNDQSIFASIGKAITPIFKPCGFGDDWRKSVSLLTGFVAKEAVVSTLGILFANDTTNLTTALTQNFTTLSAYSYLVFILLYLPCVVAFATTKKEIKSWKWTLFAVSYQTGIAWIMSTMVYQVGLMLLN